MEGKEEGGKEEEGAQVNNLTIHFKNEKEQ